MIKKLFYLALGLMGSSVAMAANQDEITWDAIQNQIQNSGSVHLLAKLYGSWVLNLFGSGGAGADVVVTPVTVFAALIGVAGWSLFMILAGYVGVVGLIRTAQHGEFLGRDWDSTWVLARMLAALILSAPLATTGGSSNLAAGQTLVIRASVISSAAADIIWGKTLTAIGNERIRNDKTMQVDVNVTPDQSLNLVSKGFFHGMCYAGYMKYEETLQGDTAEQLKARRDKALTSCRMDTSLFRDKDDPSAVAARFASSGAVGQRNGDLVNGSIDLWYAPEKIHRGDLIQAATKDVAEQFYFRGFKLGADLTVEKFDDKTAQEQLLQLSVEFQSSIKKAVEQQLQAGYQNSATLFGNEAQRYGWVSAGNFYRILATQQTQINSALNTAINVGGAPFNPEEITSGLPTDDLVYYNANHAITLGDRAKEIYEGSIGIGTVMAGASGVGNAASWTSHKIGDGFDAVGLNPLRAGETTDPLVASSNIGHSLVALATAGTLASKFTPQGKAAMAAGGDTISMILFVLFAVGVVLGDIIPSLPWVYFLFGTIAWLVHVTEMFVSAPLWIAAHAAPEGSNHTSNLAAKGYNNMLYVMLYPVLAIGGFVAAMSINWIGMYMLNQTIGEQFSNQLGGVLGLLTHGIGTLVGFAFLYVGCAWIIVNTSFNLITAFPRTILNWLSTADPGHNAFDNGGHQVLGAAGGMLRHVRVDQAVGQVKKLLSAKPSKGAGKGAGEPNPDL